MGFKRDADLLGKPSFFVIRLFWWLWVATAGSDRLSRPGFREVDLIEPFGETGEWMEMRLDRGSYEERWINGFPVFLSV